MYSAPPPKKSDFHHLLQLTPPSPPPALHYNTRMPSLSDKLKSLGVKTGAQIQPPAAPGQTGKMPIAALFPAGQSPGGRTLLTQRGAAFVVEDAYLADYRHGEAPIWLGAGLGTLAAWATDERISRLSLPDLVFLDTETSGLSGGTGTYAFMVGVGRFINGNFNLTQFFMRDPAEEAPMLEAIADFIAPCAALVTYNGKAFDAPLLRARYTLHGIPSPFANFAHIDLLPLARRLWRDRLPSRTLKYIEENVLRAPRSSEEVPGYEIPWLYFDYLRTGDAAPLKGVFYHNARDVVAMAAMLNHMASLLEDPFGPGAQHGLDVIALAKLYENLQRTEAAARLYERGLEMDLPEADFWTAVRRLAALQKRRGDLDTAVRWWQQAAAGGHIFAHVELAKHYEHRLKDPQTALAHTRQAMQRVRSADLPAYAHKHWQDALEKRLERLEKKNKAG